MYYAHEAHERKPSVFPMNTSRPTQDPRGGYFADYLHNRQLSVKLARYNGWYASKDCSDSYPRVVIPAVTHKEGHVYWQARDTTGLAVIRYQSPKGPRHEALIVVEPFDEPKGIVVVEGPMDALAAAGAGYTGIALMGMYPSIATLYHLAYVAIASDNKQTLVLLDRDSSEKGMRIMLFLASQELTVQCASLPGPEKDLAECLPSTRKKLLANWFKRLFKSKSSVEPRRSERRA